MKSFLLGIAMIAMLAVSGQASVVTLDNYGSGVGFPTAPAISSVSGAFTGGSTIFTNVVGNQAGTGALGGIFVGNTSQISYTFGAGVFQRDDLVPNWLLRFDALSGGNGTLDAKVTVNNDLLAAQTVTLTAGVSNFVNFVEAARNFAVGDITSVVIDFSGAGVIELNSISATPEPASLLTAGMFSLVGGVIYRRRKNKKMNV